MREFLVALNARFTSIIEKGLDPSAIVGMTLRWAGWSSEEERNQSGRILKDKQKHQATA